MTENYGLFHQKYKTKRAKRRSFVQIGIFCPAIYFMRVKAKCSRCNPGRNAKTAHHGKLGRPPRFARDDTGNVESSDFP